MGVYRTKLRCFTTIGQLEYAHNGIWFANRVKGTAVSFGLACGGLYEIRTACI